MELDKVGELYNETKEKIRLLVSEANEKLCKDECDSILLDFAWSFNIDIFTSE